MTTFDVALSLGPTCRAKYHLRRVLGKRAARSVFDWQQTPHTALLSYLSLDFNGTFELGDMKIVAGGVVMNVRYGTSHQHQFSEDITGGQFTVEYFPAKTKHEERAAGTRALLKGEKPLLVVMSDRAAHNELEAIERAIATYNPSLPFRLLNAPAGGDVGPTWTGSDAAWDELLGPYAPAVSAALLRLA